MLLTGYDLEDTDVVVVNVVLRIQTTIVTEMPKAWRDTLCMSVHAPVFLTPHKEDLLKSLLGSCLIP